MDDYDQEAADIVITTIRKLVSSGQRAYSLSVPAEAEEEFVRMGGGTITHTEASRKIREAIYFLTEEGRIKSSAAPNIDWAVSE